MSCCNSQAATSIVVSYSWNDWKTGTSRLLLTTVLTQSLLLQHTKDFARPRCPGGPEPDPEELEEASEIVAPTRVRAFPVCPDPEAYDGAKTVQGRMYEVFPIEEGQLSGPYELALEVGWTSW